MSIFIFFFKFSYEIKCKIVIHCIIESKEVSYQHRAGYTLLISSVARPAGNNQRSTCHFSLVLGMQLDASCLSQTQQDVVSAAPTKCPTVIRTVDTIPSFVNSSHIG